MHVPKLSDTNLPLFSDKKEADPNATEDEIDSDTSSADFQGKGSDVVPTGKHFSQHRLEPETKKRKIGCNYNPSYNEASTSKGITNGHFSGHTSKIKPISTSRIATSPKKNKTTSLTSDTGKMIVKEIRSLRAEVKDIAEQQKTLLLMMEVMSDASYADKKSFAQEYGLDLPFKNIAVFTAFDSKLETDEDFTHRFKASLNSSFNKDTGVRKALKLIIQKYLTREMVMQFTVVKKVVGKEVFKEFKFCTCVLDLVRDKFNTTEEEVLSHLSTVFWNAKDWDGNRKQRSK